MMKSLYQTMGRPFDESFADKILAKEPDLIQWTDWRTGYPCLMRRSETSGTWCGYVVVPRIHALCRLKDNRLEAGVNRCQVHGGVTYSEMMTEKELSFWDIEGLPADGMLIGFDTAHYMDRMLFVGGVLTQGVYRDMKYVTREVRKLAQQLKVMEKSTSVKNHLLYGN